MESATHSATRSATLLTPLRRTLANGLSFNWQTVLLLAAINTSIATILWVEDARPFWQPLVTVQIYGFSIAFCVNAAQPWARRRPIPRLMLAVAIGTLIGIGLTILVKGYSLDYVTGNAKVFLWNLVTGFCNGLFVSLFFYVKFREAQAAAALHKAEVERHLLSKQTIEAELKLMQAQVEPHFLFNTLASVQFLTESDPRKASRLLGHLVDYLRAALPQLRASSASLGKEVGLAEAYLNILRTRLGVRLGFTIDVPPDVATHPYPPNLLISLVENAIKHGIEPCAGGGSVSVRARREGKSLVVTVEDTGRGLGASTPGGYGVGLANVRDRLAALYGTQGRFTLEPGERGGAKATLAIPFEPHGDGEAASVATVDREYRPGEALR